MIVCSTQRMSPFADSGLEEFEEDMRGETDDQGCRGEFRSRW